MRKSALICLALALTLAAPWPYAQESQPPESAVVPAGTVLEIRLRETVSSFGSRPDSSISATVIAPVVIEGRTVLPMETQLFGRIRNVRGVGLGFARERAMLDLEFSVIQLPGQPLEGLTGKIVGVDNAREQVDEEGRIRGVRATNTFSTIFSAAAIAASSFDPMALMFGTSSAFGVFRFPDATIILPAGSEFHFEVGEDLAVSAGFPPQYPALFTSDETQAEMDEMIRPMPFRTTTETGEPSDLTSLLFVGPEEVVERAFLAAGWTRTDELDAQSTFGVMRSIMENQGYQAAPMSLLVLDGREPILTFAKTLNTFFSRHHVRVYRQNATYRGQPVWTSTATYDSGIGFAKAARTFIHLIDENIDKERSKVVNDLLLTGCVDGVGYLERPWVPRDASNATGDSLLTNGRIAVVDFNECSAPEYADEPEVWAADVQERLSALRRPFRNAILRLRHDFTRGNIAYQVAAGGWTIVRTIRGPGPNTDVPRTISLGGQEFQIVSGARPVADPEIPAEPGRRLYQTEQDRLPPSYVTHLMFSVSSGLSGYGNDRFFTQPLTLVFLNPDGSELVRNPFDVESRYVRGWTLAPKTTFNTWRYISNEFSWSRTITNSESYGVQTGPGGQTGAILDLRYKVRISKFTYNVLFHLRPNGKRIRPYLAVGPAIQLVHFTESKPSPANSLLRLAARDLTVFLSAYDFGRKPPANGGGMFQVGLDYGAGVHLHLTPRFFLRADFRETLSQQPNFWRGSQQYLQDGVNGTDRMLDVPQAIDHGLLRHQLVTTGIGVSF